MVSKYTPRAKAKSTLQAARSLMFIDIASSLQAVGVGSKAKRTRLHLLAVESLVGADSGAEIPSLFGEASDVKAAVTGLDVSKVPAIPCFPVELVVLRLTRSAKLPGSVD